MAVANFDELNILESGLYEVPEKSMRSEPYDEYFGDMYLTQEQVDDRVELAETIEEPITVFLLLMLMMREREFDPAIPRDALITELENADVGDVEYRESLADELLDSTLENMDDPWFFSEDRAIFVAENESNTLENKRDFERAKRRGFRRKQWIGIPDRRERDTHRALNNVIIPIDEYFQIGHARGLFPKDVTSVGSTLSSHPEEVVNCRCVCNFLP